MRTDDTARAQPAGILVSPMQDQLTPGRAARHDHRDRPRRTSLVIMFVLLAGLIGAPGLGRELLPGLQECRRRCATRRHVHGRGGRVGRAGRSGPPRAGCDPVRRVRRQPPDAGDRQVVRAPRRHLPTHDGHDPRGGRRCHHDAAEGRDDGAAHDPAGLPPDPDRGPGGGGTRDPGEDVHGPGRRAATSRCRPTCPKAPTRSRGSCTPRPTGSRATLDRRRGDPTAARSVRARGRGAPVGRTRRSSA